MAKYAEATRVSVSKSKTEIEKTLMRYGCDEFFYGIAARGTAIGFKFKGREIKLNIPLPDRNEYRQNQTGETKWKQEQRRRWRVLLLWIKANLELIETGLISFEDVFLAQTCLPDGNTISHYIQPLIDQNKIKQITGEN